MDTEPKDPTMQTKDFFDDNSSSDADAEADPEHEPTSMIDILKESPPKKPTEATHLAPPGTRSLSIDESKPGPPPRPHRSPEIASTRSSGVFGRPPPVLQSGLSIPAIRRSSGEPVSPLDISKRQSFPNPNRFSRAEPDGSAAFESEQILNAHAITLEALLRSAKFNPDAAKRLSIQSAPLSSEHNSVSHERNRVSIVPPPIDLAKAKASKAPYVRTPYPINIRKSFLRHQSHVSTHPPPNEALLVLSLRSQRARKVTQLRIPSPIDITQPVPSLHSKPVSSEKHFATLDYDDLHFFNEVHKAYASLSGPLRHFSARKLRAITVAHSEGCVTCRYSARSPLRVAAEGLSDSFSESNMLRQYKNPRMGKAQYVWVHWAHRLASTPTHLLPPAPLPISGAERLDSASRALDGESEAGKEDCVGGLEFVKGWAVGKIVCIVVLVMALAVLGALLWVFQGVSPRVLQVGYVGAGERVGAGCLVGILVLGLGWTAVGIWVVVSWLLE